MMRRWNLEVPQRFDQWADAGAFNAALSRRGGKVLSHARLNGHNWLTVELPQSVDPMQLPGVLLAEPDEPIFPVATISPAAIDRELSWAALHVGADQVHRATKGEGIRIAVLDSGLTVASEEFTGARIIATESLLPGGDATDSIDHGTVITSILCSQGINLLGMSPESEYIILKVLGPESTGSVLAAAINRSRELGAHIINMSLVGSFSQMIEDSLEAFTNSGGLVFGAVGNNGDETVHNVRYPAASPYVIGVASIDSNNIVASSSAWGPWPASPDCAGPGVRVVGVSRTGGYREASGTSLATPIVTGCFGLAMSHRPDDWRMNGLEIDPKYGIQLPSHLVRARRELERTSQALADGRDKIGYGLIDAQGIVGAGSGISSAMLLLLAAGALGVGVIATRGREAR